MGSQIFTNHIITPLGPLLAGATENGLCLLEFIDSKRAKLQLGKLKHVLKADSIDVEHQYLSLAEQQLKEYFSGKRKVFSVPLDAPGTDFQVRVWDALKKIPYGSTRTYSDQAQTIKSPNAIRAVGRANGDNRIAIIIPCHRVIGINGTLTGYGGGLWRKDKLLQLEIKNL